MTIHFAYGSNMSGRQMTERCPDAVALGQAWLPGYAFTIGERGYATLVPDAGVWTPGVLWDLTATCEATLDRREGVAIGCYEREHLRVVAVGGAEVDALVYIDPRIAPGTPNDGYMAKVVRGALEFGLAPEYVRSLVAFDPTVAGLLPDPLLWFLALDGGCSVSGETAADVLVALGIQWWGEILAPHVVRERLLGGLIEDGDFPDDVFLHMLADIGFVGLPDNPVMHHHPDDLRRYAAAARRHPCRRSRGAA